MPITDRIGVGVVGLGMAAAPHARSLQELSALIDVRGVYCRDQTRREQFAQQYGFPCATAPQSIADDPQVDAVLLLTPPNACEELVTLFADAG